MTKCPRTNSFSTDFSARRILFESFRVENRCRNENLKTNFEIGEVGKNDLPSVTEGREKKIFQSDQIISVMFDDLSRYVALTGQ